MNVTREELKELAQGMLDAHGGNTAVYDNLSGYQQYAIICTCRKCTIAREVLKSRYGCHCDGEVLLTCSIDDGNPENCVQAMAGKTKETCGYWREY